MRHSLFSLGFICNRVRSAALPRRRKACRLELEPLEDRNLLTVEAVSLANPSLLADAGGGRLTSARSVSQDGRYSVFISTAANLVAGQVEANTREDVFLYDRDAGTTTLVSRSIASPTTTGNQESTAATISADGRYIAFQSRATNLMPGQIDLNNIFDVFLYDRIADTTTLVSHRDDSLASTGNDTSFGPVISSDGRYVAFQTQASNLVTGQVGFGGVFLYDRTTGTNVMVSHASSSLVTAGNSGSGSPSVSADGRYVAFQSLATNLIAGQVDSNSASDVFLFDRDTGVNVLVSHRFDSFTTTADRTSDKPQISSDGAFVVFESVAAALVPGQIDPLFSTDVFLYDRGTGTSMLVSHSSASLTTAGSSFSSLGSISNDGRYVALVSAANNLVPGVTDTNFSTDVFLYDRMGGAITLVSRSSTSATTPGNSSSSLAAVSGDGRYVAFTSSASNLVVGQTDTNNVGDFFLYERQTDTTTLASHASTSPTTTANRSSDAAGILIPAITPDGRWVLSGSEATNLIAGGGASSGRAEIVLHDRQTNSNSLVTRLAPGSTPSATANGNSAFINSLTTPAPTPVSDDGRYVAFLSTATNLVAGQTATVSGNQVFLRDRLNGTTALVSHANASSTPGNSVSDRPQVSGDGRYVVYISGATNLAAGQNDTNSSFDVFLFDRDTGVNTVVSHASSSAVTTGSSDSLGVPMISRDGRYVAFVSRATNLVTGQTDTNSALDVFLFDRDTGTITLVSRSVSPTTAGNGASDFPVISEDGRYVAFRSLATNLVAGQTDTNAVADVYLFDRDTGTVTLVSRTSTLPTATGDAVSELPVISGDGRYVAFRSQATNLVAGQTDTASTNDIFLFDRVAGTTVLVSRNNASPTTTGNGASDLAVISGDGRWVAFQSLAGNLAAGQSDGNGVEDVFLYDRDTGTTVVVSHVDFSPTIIGFGNSQNPAISRDGRWVSYFSGSTDKVAGQNDTNSAGDVFLYDRTTGMNSLVSHIITSLTTTGDLQSAPPGISRDGQVVIFGSEATNLAPNDLNQFADVFVFSSGVVPSSLKVDNFNATSTGFTARFNRALDPASLNLYDTATGSLGPADVMLTGPGGAVSGSLVLNAASDSITFVATGGPLPAGSYTATLRSAVNGFKDAAGALLDGNGDGTPGDNYTMTFPISSSPAVVVSVPDLARGPGQAVNVPAISTGLPLRISDGNGVTRVDLTLQWSASLLTVSDADPSPAAPAGSTVIINSSSPGMLSLTFLSLTSLAAGALDFVVLTAQVPNNAGYTSKHVLDLSGVLVNASAARDDDGVHVVTYLGDATGNGRYAALDSQRALRVAVGLDGGFLAYPLADPRIVADVTGNGLLTSADATRILQEAVGLDPGEIPPLPAGITIVNPPGPDPLLSIPTHLRAARGGTVVVPVYLDVSEGLEAVELALAYDTSRLEIASDAHIRSGSLTGDFDLFLARHDRTAGVLRLSLVRTAGAVSGRGSGSVAEITFRVRPNAPSGSAVINLLASLGPAQTELNEGGLDLNPDPRNDVGDPLDGVITVRARPGGGRRGGTRSPSRRHNTSMADSSQSQGSLDAQIVELLGDRRSRPRQLTPVTSAPDPSLLDSFFRTYGHSRR